MLIEVALLLGAYVVAATVWWLAVVDMDRIQ